MPCICIELKIESKVSMHHVLARKQSFQTECKMESVYMRNMFMFHPTGTLIPTYIILSFFPELRIRKSDKPDPG